MKSFNKFISAAAFALLFAGAVQAQAPANDDCANATTVTCGQTVTGSTLNANIDVAPACGLTLPQYGVWYRFVGTGQAVTLSTCNATTNFDTQIGVYTGACGTLTCVTGNNNDGACASGGRKSTVTFTSGNGTVYYIWLTGVVASRGNFAMTVSCAGGPVAPANDDCANAVTVACGNTVTGTTTGANADAVGTCTTALGTAPGVWYKVVGNGGTVTASLCGSSYDTKIGVFSGTCAALTCVAGNDDFCSLQSQVNFNSTNGTTYYILVTGFSSANGAFNLTVTCTAPPPPPTGFDECAGAINLTPGATCVGTAGSNVGATQSVAPITCDGFTSNSALDVWYKFTATQANHVVIVAGATGFDPVLDVRSGSCTGTTIGCADATLSGQTELENLTGLTPGQVYLVRVYGWFGGTGSFTVCVTNGATSLAVDPSTGVEEALFVSVGKQQVGEFFPNPTQYDNTTVKVYAPQETLATVVLHDNMGRLVLNRQVELFEGVNPVELSIADLPIGTYFASITLNGEVYRRKLVIAH